MNNRKIVAVLCCVCVILLATGVACYNILKKDLDTNPGNLSGDSGEMIESESMKEADHSGDLSNDKNLVQEDELTKIQSGVSESGETSKESESTNNKVTVSKDNTTKKEEVTNKENATEKETNNPTFILSSVQLKKGQKRVNVVVSIKNNPGISSIGMNVNYGTSLKLMDVKFNKSLGGHFMPPQNNDCPVKLTWVSPFEDVNKNTDFVTLVFEVSNDATGFLPITLGYNVDDVYNMKEENIYFDVEPGGITITN